MGRLCRVDGREVGVGRVGLRSIRLIECVGATLARYQMAAAIGAACLLDRGDLLVGRIDESCEPVNLRLRRTSIYGNFIAHVPSASAVGSPGHLSDLSRASVPAE